MKAAVTAVLIIMLLIVAGDKQNIGCRAVVDCCWFHRFDAVHSLPARRWLHSSRWRSSNWILEQCSLDTIYDQVRRFVSL